MSYSYVAGSSTPGLAGLVSVGTSININEEPGTFVLTGCPGLFDSGPDVRQPIDDLPSDHGAYVGTPLYSGRRFSVQGYLQVPDLTGIEGAIEQLEGVFNLANTPTLLTVVLNRNGWSATRQVQARVNGPISYVEPEMLNKQLPEREFSVPMIAPDPRIYSTSTTSWNLEYSAMLHGIANAGNIDTPFRVVFNGPVTNPSMVWSNGTVTRKISYSGSITSGHYVQVDTNPTNGLTAIDDTGANVYANVTQFDLLTIPNGSTTNFHAEGTGYSTNVAVVTFRDAWTR